MFNFLQESNISRALFLTPIQRHNSTHFSDGPVYTKFSDLNAESLLNTQKTCVKSVQERLNFGLEL